MDTGHGSGAGRAAAIVVTGAASASEAAGGGGGWSGTDPPPLLTTEACRAFDTCRPSVIPDGLEPSSPGSEPGVLPLDDRIGSGAYGSRTRATTLTKSRASRYTNAPRKSRDAGNRTPISRVRA